MSEPLRIAVSASDDGWQQRFEDALQAKVNDGYALHYESIDIASANWRELIAPFDVIVWKPDYMGLSGAAIFKEKVYYMETFLKKLVVPNFNSVWHFESKVAQSYLFEHAGVATPATTVSFDYVDAVARIEAAKMPLVFKNSQGAASKGVRLVHTRREANRLALAAFCWRMYRERREQGGSRVGTALRLSSKRWFWRFLWEYVVGKSPVDYLYWQEFLPANEGDMKIIVIGEKYAYGFWRKNRPNDFRASGGGRIDFDRPVPENVLRYCLDLNRKFGFDSMGYDILFRGEDFVIVEMSYGYLDTCPYMSQGYFELCDDGKLELRAGHVWPETLWVEWMLEKVQCRKETTQVEN